MRALVVMRRNGARKKQKYVSAWFGSSTYSTRIRKETFTAKKLGFFVTSDSSDVILSLPSSLFWARAATSSKTMNNIVRNKTVSRAAWEMGALTKQLCHKIIQEPASPKISAADVRRFEKKSRFRTPPNIHDRPLKSPSNCRFGRTP